MVMRVTSQTQQRNALNNIFRITEAMFNAQKEITSGKKIQKPSDDPSGMRDTLALRTNIKQIKQFERNINSNQLFLSRGESALDSIGVSLSRAKELSMVELGGLSTSETRGYAKTELDNIISKVLQDANTKVKNMYIFSGTDVNTTPFEVSASGAVYKGNSDNLMVQIEEDINVKVNIPGSEVLGTDLNPDLNTSTNVSDLNGGTGITAGSFSVTDRAGTSGTVKWNATLKKFVDGVKKHDAVYFHDFITMLDKGLSDIEPDNVPFTDVKGLLTGRPVAILRLSLKLDLKGQPAINQSWDSLVNDMLGVKNSVARDCAKFTNIEFPIRLGNSKEFNEYNDGLIAYYKEAKDKSKYDYTTIYTYQADGANKGIVSPSDDLVLTADKTTPVKTVLLLMDPRGRLNITSGILPKKSIEIPVAHYQGFYSSLQAFFFTSPVLHHQDINSEQGESGIDIPVPSVKDHDWIWLDKNADNWQEKKVLFSQAKAPPKSSLLMSEGWLKLVKSKTIEK